MSLKRSVTVPSGRPAGEVGCSVWTAAAMVSMDVSVSPDRPMPCNSSFLAITAGQGRAERRSTQRSEFAWLQWAAAKSV